MKDDTHEGLLALGVLALGLLWLLRGGGASSPAGGGALRVTVQGDAFVVAGRSHSTCASLLAALPSGDVVIDPTFGTHAAVVELRDCLTAAGRSVIVEAPS